MYNILNLTSPFVIKTNGDRMHIRYAQLKLRNFNIIYIYFSYHIISSYNI